MNDKDFAFLIHSLQNNILKSAQWEKIFDLAWAHFRYDRPADVEYKAVAWRIKQAGMLLKHRKA